MQGFSWRLLGILRVVLALPVLAFGLLVSPFIGLMSGKVFSVVARNWYCCLLLTLGIRCRYEGQEIENVSLVVSNHISWADILVIGARFPFVFLAMKEVAGWPVAGWLARRAGTLFITRGTGADDAVEQISASLEAGRSVIVFPEGRTSTGVAVRRFHSRILEAAVATGCPVVPIALFYADRGGDQARGSRVTFDDEVGFAGSVWRTLCGPRIDASMTVFPALDEPLDRHQLAGQSYRTIADHIRFTVDSSPRE